MVYIKNMCLVIHIVPFYSYKLSNMGIQGNENSFFTWYLKVFLNRFFWILEFVSNESKIHYLGQLGGVAQAVFELLLLLIIDPHQQNVCNISVQLVFLKIAYLA